MGCCYLCPDSAKQEPDSLVDLLGTRATWCLLEQSSHPICFSQHQETTNIIGCVCTSVLLHDTYCCRAITSKSWWSRKGCSFSQACGRTVSTFVKALYWGKGTGHFLLTRRDQNNCSLIDYAVRFAYCCLSNPNPNP